MEITYQVPLFIASWFIQMGVHEGAHAYAADYFGDDTARLLGKRSFNPLNHIEWGNINSILWSIGLPVFTAMSNYVPMGMAWVPVNPLRLRDREKSMAIISFAGPLGNFVLVALCILLHIGLGFLPQTDMRLEGAPMGIGSALWLFDEQLKALCLTSALYGFFNLVPLPPLDGSSVLRYFLPQPGKEVMDQVAPYGMMILVVLFWFGNAGIIIDIPLAVVMGIWNFIG